VPVSVRSKREAVELSLAENQSRDDMHPADAIEAYGKLAQSGLASDDIAARFGVTPVHVNRILALAGLHPDIRAALARDEIGLEAARAYTLTGDPEQQQRLFEEFGNAAHMIRRALTGDKIATGSALFNLVPLADYLDAGGTITRDLFSEGKTGFADNPELLWTLAQQCMENIREEYLADGWPLVDILDCQPDNYYALNHLRPQGRRELSDEEAARLTQLQEDALAITEADPDAQPWNNDKLRAIADAIGEIEQSRQFYTDEQKTAGRVLIFTGYDDTLTIQPVALRKKERVREGNGEPPARFSRALCEAMERIRLLAIREALAERPDLALDLLIAALIEDRLAYGVNSPLAIRTSAAAVQVDDALLGNARFADIEQRAADLCAEIDREQLLASIATMEDEPKQQLLAVLIATLVDTGSRLPEDIGERLAIDMGRKWQPTEAFFARMTKPVLLELLREECGEDAANNCRKLQKSALAEETARRLAEKNWMPPMLAA
jgi:ParB family chromosome partitioning protein